METATVPLSADPFSDAFDLAFAIGMDPDQQKYYKLEQGTDEWVRARKSVLISASDIATVINTTDKMKSLSQLVEEKRNKKERSVTDYVRTMMEYGKLHEPVAKEKIKDMFTWGRLSGERDKLRWKESGFWVSKTDPELVGCSLDGVWFSNRSGPIVVEIKCPYRFGHPETVKDRYKAQLFCQMKLTGISRAYFITYVPYKREFEDDGTPRDPEKPYEPLRVWAVKLGARHEKRWKELMSEVVEFGSLVNGKGNPKKRRRTAGVDELDVIRLDLEKVTLSNFTEDFLFSHAYEYKDEK